MWLSSKALAQHEKASVFKCPHCKQKPKKGEVKITQGSEIISVVWQELWLVLANVKLS